MIKKYSEDDGKIFLDYVRSILAGELSIPGFTGIDVRKYSDRRGVFVTLTLKGNLRGCIGYPYPTLPLNIAVEKAAKSAAFSDPRFPPVSRDEFNSLSFEVSVLTLPCEIIVEDRIMLPEKITVGRDGLIVEHGAFSGLLLPQVATEWNFDSRTFLDQVCVKAGLPKNSWMRKDCKIFTFEAQVFH